MAITQTVTNSAKLQFLSGSVHTTGSTYMIALYNTNATLTGSTSVYSSVSESVGTGYTQGGQILTGYNSGLSASVAYLNWTNPTWPSSSITAQGALIYNTSGSASVAVLNFSVPYTSTSGSFTIIFPSASLLTLN